MSRMISRAPEWVCGPDQSTYDCGAYSAPRMRESVMSNAMQRAVEKVQSLRCDLSGYRRQGDFAAVAAGLKELRAAQRELDRLVEARMHPAATAAPRPAWT